MNVLLVDDHLLFGEALKGLVESISIVKEVKFAYCGDAAIAEMEKMKFDVVLLDISLVNETGFDVFPKLISKQKDIKVIALTSHGDKWTINKALDNGFHGFLLKSDGRSEIEVALLSIADSKPYISAQVNVEELQKVSKTDALTDREMQVLKAICDGMSTKEIANNFFISIKTVETHRANLHNKLDAKNINELIKKAYSLNIIPLID